jgi:hypothetical protein
VLQEVQRNALQTQALLDVSSQAFYFYFYFIFYLPAKCSVMRAKKRSTDPSTARCIITGRSVSPYIVPYVSIRQHTYTSVSIRQHTYIYIKLSDLDGIFCMKREVEPLRQLKIELYGSTLVSSLHSQKGSAYVSIRQHP